MLEDFEREDLIELAKIGKQRNNNKRDDQMENFCINICGNKYRRKVPHKADQEYPGCSPYQLSTCFHVDSHRSGSFVDIILFG